MTVGSLDKTFDVAPHNGSEFTSNAILAWADQNRAEWHYIAPGKPMQNGFGAAGGTAPAAPRPAN